MVTVYLQYLVISVVLTIVTATILARSGRTFLTHMLGGDEAVLVIGVLHLVNVFALTRVGRRAGRPSPVVLWRPASQGKR